MSRYRYKSDKSHFDLSHLIATELYRHRNDQASWQSRIYALLGTHLRPQSGDDYAYVWRDMNETKYEP